MQSKSSTTKTARRSLRRLIRRRAEVWEQHDSGDDFLKGGWNHATIGVNWSAYGPVCPSEARKIARALLHAAKNAERRIKTLRQNGWTVN